MLRSPSWPKLYCALIQEPEGRPRSYVYDWPGGSGGPGTKQQRPRGAADSAPMASVRDSAAQATSASPGGCSASERRLRALS